jgi:hypothetical protein
MRAVILAGGLGTRLRLYATVVPSHSPRSATGRCTSTSAP